ncbi:hypothetical protein Tco_1345416 [Tanacetum coccineum]
MAVLYPSEAQPQIAPPSVALALVSHDLKSTTDQPRHPIQKPYIPSSPTVNVYDLVDSDLLKGLSTRLIGLSISSEDLQYEIFDSPEELEVSGKRILLDPSNITQVAGKSIDGTVQVRPGTVQSVRVSTSGGVYLKSMGNIEAVGEECAKDQISPWIQQYFGVDGALKGGNCPLPLWAKFNSSTASWVLDVV